nr:hypothetical protein GCM10020092_073240 [Actinoplanes digitatis]
MPEQRLSATIEVSSSLATWGVEPQPRVGQVCPQPMIRVAVPTAPEAVGIGAGACDTDVVSSSSLMSLREWLTARRTETTVPPLLRLMLPTRTELGVGQCLAVTAQLALMSEPVQPETYTMNE